MIRLCRRVNDPDQKQVWVAIRRNCSFNPVTSDDQVFSYSQLFTSQIVRVCDGGWQVLGTNDRDRTLNYGIVRQCCPIENANRTDAYVWGEGQCPKHL